jgi:hypothetical protein
MSLLPDLGKPYLLVRVTIAAIPGRVEQYLAIVAQLI